MKMEETVSNYVQEQFQAFQIAEIDEGSEIVASSRMAATIEKNVLVLTLNDAMTKIGLDQSQADSSVDISTFVVPLLTKYVDAAITMEIDASTRTVVRRVFHLVSALACCLASKGDKPIHAVTSRVETFSNVVSEKLRSQACMMMGCMASHLIALSTRCKKKNIERKHLKENISVIEKILLPRLTDKSQSVRQRAIQAAGMLLGPSTLTSSNSTLEESSSNLALVEGLLWSMWHDPSVTNRVEAIQAVPIDSAETLDHVIARIRDVKEKVRNAAISALHKNVDPRRRDIMTEEHFRDIIRSGLTERCESTNTATMALICTKWMKASKFCPVELMRITGATVFEEESEKALKVVLTMAHASNSSRSNTILQELSDPEIRSLRLNIEKSMIRLQDPDVVFDEYQLFYTRVACSAARESSDLTFSQKEALMTKTIPDIPTLCDLFKKHLERFVDSIQEEDEECIDQECFVCLQLLQLAKIAGIQEEGSRRHFSTVMSDALSNIETPDEVIEDCVEALRATFQNQSDFFNAISEVLATLTSSAKFDGVEEKTDARLLFIFSVVLENSPPKVLNHDLFDVMTKIILSAVGSNSTAIREVAIGGLGKLGLFLNSNIVISEFKPLLLKIVANKEEAVRCRGQALLALSDLALLYPDILQPCRGPEFGENVNFSLVVKEMMEHKNVVLATIGAEVATKLLFSMNTTDTSLIPALLVSYLDPNKRVEYDDSVDQDTDIKDVGSPLRLQQLLSIFFPAFCLKSDECRDALLGSIGSAMSVAVDYSPKTKGKTRSSAFPLVKIVEYVLSVVAASEIPSKTTADGATVHSNVRKIDASLSVSIQVAKFLVQAEQQLNVTQLRSLCKFLGSREMNIEVQEKRQLGMLKDLIEELSFIDDYTSLKSLRPLTELLSNVRGYEESNDDDKDQYSDDNTLTEDSMDGRSESVGETTIEDGIMMKGIARLSLENKENPPSIVQTKNRRSSVRSNISDLEPLGTLNM